MTSDFKATEEEHQLASRILVMTCCDETGALSSDAAIDIFKRSGLSFTVLRDIWNIADKNGRGILSLDELAVAIRLMGWVQMGEALDDGLLLKAGPLPTLEGITDVVWKHASSSQAQQFPPIVPDDLRHYKQVFISAGPVNGRLDGDKVINSFMTSNLSYEELSKIRELIDRTHQGSLGLPEFSLGMYLIQALQSCLISSVPSSIPPHLFDQFPDLQPGDLGSPSRRLSRAHMSTSSLRPSSSRPHLSPMPSSSRSLPTLEEPHDLDWAILPHEKAEADQHFAELDVERKGYVDGEPVGRLFLSYGLPPEDLQQIWELANLNNDNRLTPDGFAIALHLIRQRVAGAEIPRTLPSSLIPPARSTISRRTSIAAPTSPNLSAVAKSKPPPPPPPKRDRTSSIRVPNGAPVIATSPTIPSSTSTSPNPRYTVPLSVPVSPVLPTPDIRSKTPLTAPSISMMNAPSSKSSELVAQSPFEDAAPAAMLSPVSRRSSVLQPRPPDKANTEALEEWKKETARLTAQVDNLLSQLTAQNKLRDSNESLRSENDTLKTQLREMERTVSEVLSATDLNGSKDEYIQQVDQLTAELAGKDSQIENLERMLAVVTQDERELRDTLRDSQQATAKAKSEVETLKSTISTQAEEISELKSRLTDMGRAMSEPATNANNRELRVLIRDVTKENDQLKGRVRDMEKSMEQLLLSSKFHARADEVDRENKRLKQHVQELEMEMIAQSQSRSQTHLSTSSSSSRPPTVVLSSHPTLNGRSSSSQSGASSSSSPLPTRGVESLTRENDQLKAQLNEGLRKLDQLKSSSQSKISELQQKIETLARENNRLKVDIGSRSAMPSSHEDNSVPPPAYDDAFVIPS